jgi:hypothetical protein
MMEVATEAGNLQHVGGQNLACPEIPERVLIDTQAAAFMVNVSPATIRSWASRGHLSQHGVDKRGRALYDQAEVYVCAARPRSKGGRPRKHT